MLDFVINHAGGAVVRMLSPYSSDTSLHPGMKISIKRDKNSKPCIAILRLYLRGAYWVVISIRGGFTGSTFYD